MAITSALPSAAPLQVTFSVVRDSSIAGGLGISTESVPLQLLASMAVTTLNPALRLVARSWSTFCANSPLCQFMIINPLIRQNN